MLSYIIRLISNTTRYFQYETQKLFEENQLVIYRSSCGVAVLCWMWELLKSRTFFQPIMENVEECFWFNLYWFFMGVLSSVGLGTGLHTGILFLMPFITQMNSFIYQHYTLDFPVYGRHAFQLTSSTYDVASLRECPSEFEMNSLFALRLFWKFYSVVFWWAFGSAVGEVPPYLFSRACLAELDVVNNPNIKKMLDWMIDYLDKYGFWMILGFASYPNMLFDMCGICCGLMGMRFLDFFIPVFIGKAIIKAGVQTAIWVLLSYPGNLEKFDLFAKNQLPTAVYSYLDVYLHPDNTLASGSNQESSWTGYLWNSLVMFLCIKFFYSILIYFSNKWESLSRDASQQQTK